MPRAGLSTSRVVEEAGDLMDEVGLEGLTLAALADRLGVRQPSLYKHVNGLEALRHLVALDSRRQLGEVMTQAAVGKARADALVAIANAYRIWAARHPGRYATTQRAPAPGDDADAAISAQAIATLFAVTASYGLEGDDAVDAIRSLRAALHGFVSLEAGGAFAMPVDVDRSFERLVKAMERAFANWSR